MIKLLKKIYWKSVYIKNDLLSSISLWLYNFSSRKVIDQRRLEHLKDIHKGKRAFIICNGPSLKAEDLSVLQKHQEITFAANRIMPMIEKSGWNPTYYTVADSSGLYVLYSTMNTVAAKLKFFPQDGYLIGKRVAGDTVFFNRDGNRDLLEAPMFSDDISKIVYSIGTVTYISLQIAIYMGIKEFYITGCDNRYAAELQKDGTIVVHEGLNNYFEGVTGKIQKAAGNSWEQNIAFDAAKKYADEHGIRIYNATRGGYLEIFERVDFDTLFEDK